VSWQSVSETATALETERQLFPATRLLQPCEAVGRAKALLVRPTAQSDFARRRVYLHAVATEYDWRDYTEHRVAVEAGFGLDEWRARSMVEALRRRCGPLGMGLYLAYVHGKLVGAIGRLRLDSPHRGWARLQEVDIFPSWRGRGYGDGLLTAVLDLLTAEGSTMAVLGADEDDWPLSWYRRRGFRDVARVPLTR
jgi:GNAT superfamily N-acetyltransferase